MSDNNFKDYNLDNFSDEPQGKHFRPDPDAFNNTNSNFNYDLDNFKSEPVVNKINKQEKPKQPDYGDDFYSDSNSFEPNDDDDFQPVITRKSYSRTANIPDKNKNKNIAIIVLSITLALVIFIFSLIFFMGSKTDNIKTKPTRATVVASETVKSTQPTQKPAETDAPTQAPTDAPTEAPTEFYEEPTYEEPEYIEDETTSGDPGYVEEPTYEVIS